jgi:hypothetical protein
MKALSRFALLGCALLMKRQGAFAQTQNCPAGTMRELDSGRRLPVQEVPVTNPQPASEQPPSLLELRQGQNPKLPTPEPNASVPPPGGIGGGITYLNGQLQAIDGGSLYQADCRRPEGSWQRASRGPGGLITKFFLLSEGVESRDDRADKTARY